MAVSRARGNERLAARPHEDKRDELVFVEISTPRPRPSTPPDASPRARLCHISECQAKSPSMQAAAAHRSISFISPPYLFILALPLPFSLGSNKKRLNSRRGREKMNKDTRLGPHGGFSGRACGWQRWDVERRGLKGGRFPAEDSAGSGHKGSGWASTAKPPTPAPFSEATIGR